MTDLLRLKGVEASYRDHQVLFGIDLAIAPSSSVALLGANGAGKTTTLRAICGMVRTRGEITFEDERIDGRRTDQVARLGIGHVPDGRGTFLNMTVEENLQLGGYLRRRSGAMAQRMEQIFTHFPRLKERRNQQAGTLSGGEQQMLAISRALMLDPKLLLLDEPSFGLAPLIVKEIFSILRAINETNRTALLIVEQNAKLALDIAEHAYLIETGSIVMHGPSEKLKGEESIRKAYLGY
ncbi:ABC transporter ATP-binding protein [Microbaculum marinum]|uniref:ABC transporter ATP-binding protein n=1 Tax=Microbaculum marinum TaxID=1764581 RepID=A0AAW9RI43_9HYPH